MNGLTRSRGRLLLCLFTCCIAASAHGATFTVTNLTDGSPAPAGSLRQAIESANSAAGSDTIVFNAGLSGTITPAIELPTITGVLTITGPGPRILSVSGSNARKILECTASCNISGLRLANGFTDRGAAIRFSADGGMLNVSDCHFDQNLATVDGGAVVIFSGSFSFQRCTFTTDQAAGNGGCIWFGQGAGTPTASITNCTFVNNFASGSGGAIRQFNTTAYTTAVTNCTFVVNNAGTAGGAIAVAGGSMTLLNNLFTANAAGGNPGGHIRITGGTVTSLGNNLFGHLDGSNLTPDPTDKFGTVAAQLNTGILIAFPFNNGGLTDTLPFANSSSIAIDGGGATGAPTADQRGFPRVGCAPDVGAFELQTPADADNDGVINCLDTCPNTPACASVNETGCPTDGDADGVFDGCDNCPGTMAADTVDANGCSTIDEDADGVLNDADACKGTPPCAIASVDASGCPTDSDTDGLFDGCDNCPGSNDLLDADTDGIPDCLDACPLVGDTDGDGVQDCQDGCPADPLKLSPGSCGCGVLDTDTDTDGIPDCLDACPLVGDTDGDGVQDCQDGCPADPLKLSPGSCGCGTPDTDANGDMIPDCLPLPMPAPDPVPSCGFGIGPMAPLAIMSLFFLPFRLTRKRGRRL